MTTQSLLTRALMSKNTRIVTLYSYVLFAWESELLALLCVIRTLHWNDLCWLIWLLHIIKLGFALQDWLSQKRLYPELCLFYRSQSLFDCCCAWWYSVSISLTAVHYHLIGGLMTLQSLVWHYLSYRSRLLGFSNCSEVVIIIQLLSNLIIEH